MADENSIVVDDLPSTNFMLNPYFYRLLNYEEDKEGTTYTDYNKVLEYTDAPHTYEFHLISSLSEGVLFDEDTGQLTDRVTLLPDIKADVLLQTYFTEYGFYVKEEDKFEMINLGDDDVTIYGWVILDPINDFVLLYGLYDEALDVCGELFLDEGNIVQINIDTLCSEVEV